jgi:hypothetical protein
MEPPRIMTHALPQKYEIIDHFHPHYTKMGKSHDEIPM